MKPIRYAMLAAVSILGMACKKEAPSIIYPPSTKGNLSFMQSDMTVPVNASTNVVSIPIRLTVPEPSKSVTANILISNDTETTAVYGKHYQLVTMTDEDTFEGAYGVARFAPRDTVAIFPMLIAPSQITEPVSVKFLLMQYYTPEPTENPYIQYLTVHLTPAE